MVKEKPSEHKIVLQFCNFAETGVGFLIPHAVCHVYRLLGQSHRELPVFGPIFHLLFPILGLVYMRSIRVITNMQNRPLLSKDTNNITNQVIAIL